MWTLGNFLVVVTTLALAVVFVIIVIKLSGKNSPIPGIVAIVLLLALMLGINAVVVRQCSGEKLETLTAKLDNGMTAEMIVRIKGDEIRAYGPVEIVDEHGILRDCYSIDAYRGENDYVPPFTGLFEKMTAGKKVLPSWGMDKEEVADMSKKIIFIKEGGGSVAAIFDVRALFFGPFLYMGLPLLIIYVFRRRQVEKRKQAAELRRMEIENL